MSDQPIARSDGGPPQFILEVVHEVRSFLTTLRNFALHPIRSPRDWAEGRLPAMNPVAFFGAALGLELATTAVARRYQPHMFPPPFFLLPEEINWLFELLQQQVPLAAILAFALLLHWGLRSKGSTQLFRATFGVVLFVAGLDSIATSFYLAVFYGLRSPALVWRVGPKAAMLVICVELAWAIMGSAAVHRLPSWRKAVLPVIGAAVTVALAVGFLGQILKRQVVAPTVVHISAQSTPPR